MRKTQIEGRMTPLEKRVSMGALKNKVKKLEEILKEIPYIVEGSVKSEPGEYYSVYSDKHVTSIELEVRKGCEVDFGNNLANKILRKTTPSEIEKRKGADYINKKYALVEISSKLVPIEYNDISQGGYKPGGHWEIRIQAHSLGHHKPELSSYVKLRNAIKALIGIVDVVNDYVKDVKKRFNWDVQPGLRETYGKHYNV